MRLSKFKSRQTSVEEHCSWLRRGSREKEREREEEGRGGAASFSSARVEDEGKRSDVEEGNEGG